MWWHTRRNQISSFGANGRVHLKSAGASVQSTTGSRGARVSGSNAGYTMFRSSVKGTGYPLHSPVSPSTSPPVSHRVPSHFNWPLPFKVIITQVLHILYTQIVPLSLLLQSISQLTPSCHYFSRQQYSAVTILYWSHGPMAQGSPLQPSSLSVHMNADSNIHVTTFTCNKFPDLTQTTEISNRRQE